MAITCECRCFFRGRYGGKDYLPYASFSISGFPEEKPDVQPSIQDMDQ